MSYVLSSNVVRSTRKLQEMALPWPCKGLGAQCLLLSTNVQDAAFKVTLWCAGAVLHPRDRDVARQRGNTSRILV